MRGARVHEVHIKDAVPTQLPLYAGIDLSGVRGGKIVAVEPATALNSEAGQRVGGCGNEDLLSREDHGHGGADGGGGGDGRGGIKIGGPGPAEIGAGLSA